MSTTSRVPFWDGRVSAEALGHLGGIGLDLMLAIEAPHDQPDLGVGSIS